MSAGISVRRILLAVLFILLTLTLLVPLTRFLQPGIPSDTLFGSELRNFGHVPLFGGIALSLLGLMRVTLTRVRRTTQYVLALSVALLLGVVSEATQFWGPRDADLYDLVRNLIGAAAALLLLAGLDRSLDDAGEPHRPWLRPAARWGAILLLTVSLLPLVVAVHAYRARATRLPVLCAFDSLAERQFLRTRGAALLIGAPPKAWEKPAGDRVGRLNFGPGRWPSLTLNEPYPDWSGFEALEISFFSERATPVAVGLRIDDLTSAHRYHRRIDLQQGLNRVRIPLEEIRRGPPNGEIDLRRIRWLIFYAIDPPGEFGLYLDDIELSRPHAPPPPATRGDG